MSLQLPIHLQRLAVPHPDRLVSGKGGQRLLTWSLGPKLLVDTVSTVKQTIQMWHYPGSVDTVSTGLKINGVHAHRLMGERFGLRIGGDERNVLKLSGLGCV
jgi:hypothetical protein